MNIPSKYDFTKTPADWPYAWHIDCRHVRVIHDLALHAVGNVVEIGCFRGRSTIALIHALDAGADFHLHLVDIKITPELRRLVSMAKRQDRITIHETHSTAFRLPSASLWIVDGDHTWPAVLDVLNAVASGAECIVMHDSNAHLAGFKECEGASLAAASLRHHGNTPWQHAEDSLVRPGELTERGLLVCSRTQHFHGVALRSFAQHCAGFGPAP